jgi:hypothetical protein
MWYGRSMPRAGWRGGTAVTHSAWLRWCASPASRVERVEHGALVVSLDRLLPALRAAALTPPAAGVG